MQEETRRALADLLATVITTYAAVIAGNGEAAAAGLEQITAQAGAPPVRPRPWQCLPGPVWFGSGTAGTGDRSAPRPWPPCAPRWSAAPTTEVDTSR